MLEQKANEQEKWLTLQSAAFKQTQETPRWQTIQQQLQKHEAAIEFTSFNYHNGKEETDSVLYAAILIRKELAEPLLIPLFEKKQLDDILGKKETVAGKRGLYTRGVKGIKVLRKTKPLYDLVWHPLEKELAGIKKIFFAPSGELLKISFAALAVNDTQHLSDRYELLQLNTTAQVTRSEEDWITVKDSLLLFGGIVYEADTSEIRNSILKYNTQAVYSNVTERFLKEKKHFYFLPGTLDEVVAIKNNAARAGFALRLIKGTEAVEESFKNIEGMAAPAVLHIATHGFFNEEESLIKTGSRIYKKSTDPLLRSGLLFAGAQNTFNGIGLPGKENGVATALEISNMYLPGTKLVVLSACETALGQIQGNEGVYGLQRAFKMAGVKYLLMSLWEVGDMETAQFMKLFYDQLFLNQSMQKSFSSAQAVMRNKYRNQPEKWGAWVLVR